MKTNFGTLILVVATLGCTASKLCATERFAAWVATKSDKAIVFVGELHDQKVFPEKMRAEDARQIQNAQTLLIELTDPKGGMGETLMDPQHRRLSDRLGDARFERAWRQIEANMSAEKPTAVSKDFVDRMRPFWVLAMTVNAASKNLHGSPRYDRSSTHTLTGYAITWNPSAPRIGLETAEDRQRLGSECDRDEDWQAAFDSALLAAGDRTLWKAFYEDFPAALKSGDALRILEADNAAANFSGQPHLMKCTIEPANKRWISKIAAHGEKNNKTVVVVGIGHLMGPNSLLALIASHGWRVRPMFASKPEVKAPQFGVQK